jgi:arginyl-tRNA synthetase
MIEERLIALVTKAQAEVARELDLAGDLPEVELSKPRQKEHGDFATNVALVLAPLVGRSSRDVAELVRRHLPEARFVRSAEVAGPGFINFRLTTGWLTDALRDVARPTAAPPRTVFGRRSSS